MKKLLLKTFLLVVGLLAGTSVWAQKVTWSANTTTGTEYIGGSEQSSNTAIVSITLGASGSTWYSYKNSSYFGGVRCGDNTNAVTLTDKIPTAGTFVKIVPTVNVSLSARVYNYIIGDTYIVCVDGESNVTGPTSVRRGSSTGDITTTSLTAGNTYYLYFGSWKNDAYNAAYGFISFTAKTTGYVNLETEISSATTLKSTLEDGQTALQSAIDVAQGVLDNANSDEDDYIAARKTLLEAEGTFYATNGNQDYILSSSDYLFNGRVIRNVYGIVMTFGGDDNYDTWSTSSYAVTGIYTGNSYTHRASANNAPTNSGGRCNGTETSNKLPNRGAYYTFTPTVSGVLTVAGMYTGSRNTFMSKYSDKKVIDYYNPSSNYYGERAYKFEAGETYYLWTDNAQFYIFGFHYEPANVDNIIGDVNYLTEYCAATSNKVTLKPSESYHYRFVNHNSNGSKNWLNWVLPVYNISDNRVITVRADNWEDVGAANTGCTSAINWTGFVQNMNGAIVDMMITFTVDKKFNMTSTISPSDGSSDWTYSYTNDYTDSPIDLTGNDYIKVALSVSESWLEILSEEQTVVSATITPAGWTTFSSPYALDLRNLDGATAYYASEASGSKVRLTATNSNAVAAGEGIMLKGTANANITIPVVETGTAIIGNLLKGQTTAGEVAASGTEGKYHYVFGFQTEKPSIYGFYNLASATNIPAGKAYLETTEALTPKAGARLTIVFDDETTAVSEEFRVKSDEFATAPVYNLNGQRIEKPAKGLYISGGKKFMVK